MKRQISEKSPVSETIRELADALRDVILATPDSCAADSPEDVYVDLATRLMLRLSKRLLTVTPEHSAAASRIFSSFTKWMLKTRGSYVTKIDEASGRFEFTASTPAGVHAFYGGSSIQDAYGQAAMTLEFNGDSL